MNESLEGPIKDLKSRGGFKAISTFLYIFYYLGYNINMNPVRNLAKNNWYVYVIESLKDKLWYTGCTDNLIKRLKDHNGGKVYATKHRRPLILIYLGLTHLPIF